MKFQWNSDPKNAADHLSFWVFRLLIKYPTEIGLTQDVVETPIIA
jgi:hypothetical protein